jgi:hypothetical protein
VAAILGGAQPADTFSHDDQLSRTRVYLIAILAFSALQNSIVRVWSPRGEVCIHAGTSEIRWFDDVPAGEDHSGVKERF